MKKRNPRLSISLRRMKREEGMPEAVAVDTDIASGSLTSPRTLVIHVRNWSRGSGKAVDGVRDSGASYWL